MGLRYPIFQGGMAWASSGKLACAVSNAGGLGILGCAGRKAEWVLNEIEYIKNNTLKDALKMTMEVLDSGNSRLDLGQGGEGGGSDTIYLSSIQMKYNKMY